MEVWYFKGCVVSDRVAIDQRHAQIYVYPSNSYTLAPTRKEGLIVGCDLATIALLITSFGSAPCPIPRKPRCDHPIAITSEPRGAKQKRLLLNNLHHLAERPAEMPQKWRPADPREIVSRRVASPRNVTRVMVERVEQISEKITRR